MTTFAAVIAVPSASLISKAPRAPEMRATSLLKRTLTPFASSPARQVSRMSSREPAAKASALLSGRRAGVAMTYLPFWYFWMVSAKCGARSRRRCETLHSAARPAALMPAGPEPTMTTS